MGKSIKLSEREFILICHHSIAEIALYLGALMQEMPRIEKVRKISNRNFSIFLSIKETP